MFIVRRRFYFCASHRYFIKGLSEEENRRIFGKLFNQHGHNYTLFVSVKGDLQPTGMVINIKEIKSIVKDIIDERYDHRNLNLEHPAFKEKNPTTENIAKQMWQEIREALRGKARLYEIRLSEGRELTVIYRGGEKMILSREYHFSAGHRLFDPNLSEEENFRIYGRCSNPHGHGHDYTLRVYVEGKPDEKTGFLIDINEMDRIVMEAIETVDHKFLNEEVDFFREHLPTTENILLYFCNILKGKLPLHKLEIMETENNIFELECR